MSRGIFKSTSVVGAMTLISRITGLARDMVYSQAFGAGALMDAFLVAFKIPNFLRRLFAEGSFSQAFVPVVSEYRIRRTQDEVRELVEGTAG
ncbi:MAG TPA: lipid II flippase MurJ, partial [Steroidobacteraceae bacterium]|nr:lipid II flippase MurJ [Steroidobacteraceae bacterium]